ncbi:hypothetical protein VTK73DRAFT_3254 [Phialemonium thermophilum]|uniref:Fibroin-3 related protein n=1 Tax=Phialemonium thermophilum TaxID=223376 RepID=A0ABR3Y8M2_9PEZI
MRPVVESRDAVSDVKGKITDVKTAFSSWDNCMQASFCKWPAIALMVIAGLIILSVVWCIARCLCCGLSCCCECCYCLKCCGDCCGCCDPPRKRHKYLDDPFVPPHHHDAYKAPEPMHTGVPFQRTAEPPQYAEFDVSRKGAGHEDSLPVMPSWENANSRKVLVEEEAVELSHLNGPEANPAGSVHGQNIPLMTGAGATPGPASPIGSPANRSPYGPPRRGPDMPGGYMGQAGASNDPYELEGQGYSNSGGNHGPSMPSPAVGVDHTDQGYGMAAGALPTGRHSPRDYNQAGFGAEQGYRGTTSTTPAYDSRPRQDPYGDYSHQPPQGFGMGAGRRSPAVRGMTLPTQDGSFGLSDRMRQSPAPMGDYGAGYGGRPYGMAPAGARHPSPDPARALGRSTQRPANASSMQGQGLPPSPTNLQNTAGFDFSSGFSRPAPGPAPTSPTPPPPTGAPAAYPGYRAYQP